MRRGWLVLVVAALAAGCGSKSKAVRHSTSATSGVTGSTAASRDCNTLGINPTEMREGTCTHAGITYVIVDENHTLELQSLAANLGAIRTVAPLPGSHPTTAQDKFLVISIKVTNRLALPQTFDNSGTQQAGLILAGTVYKEDAGVERSFDPHSCPAANVAIGSGKSVVCRAVFDVPGASAADLGKHGSGDLYLVDFGSDLASSTPPQTVGQIRLYH